MTQETDRRIRRTAIVVIMTLLVGTMFFVGRDMARYQAGTYFEAKFSSFSKPKVNTVGEQVNLPEASVIRSRHTVILIARSNCSACQASQVFFREIASTVKAHNQTALVFIPTQALNEDERRFIIGSNIDLASVRELSAGQLAHARIHAVPTLLVVDPDRRIQYIHTGILTVKDLTQVKALLAQ